MLIRTQFGVELLKNSSYVPSSLETTNTISSPPGIRETGHGLLTVTKWTGSRPCQFYFFPQKATQTDKQTDIKTYKLMKRNVERQLQVTVHRDIQIDTENGRHTDRHTDRQTAEVRRHTNTQTELNLNQIYSHTRQADKRTDI